MKARMPELLRLLTMVVDRVRAANERSERAEGQVAQMSLLLDAMADDNAALRSELDQAEEAAAEAQATTRGLRDQVETAERLAELLEARATDAELRIHRAADALGLPAPLESPAPVDDAPRPSVALH